MHSAQGFITDQARRAVVTWKWTGVRAYVQETCNMQGQRHYPRRSNHGPFEGLESAFFYFVLRPSTPAVASESRTEAASAGAKRCNSRLSNNREELLQASKARSRCSLTHRSCGQVCTRMCYHHQAASFHRGSGREITHRLLALYTQSSILRRNANLRNH